MRNDGVQVEEIGDIVGAACKELAIEQGIQEVKDHWRKADFDFVEHKRGEQSRGSVLGTTEEITLVLDETAMSLQSMSASRHGRFDLP